MDLEVVGRHALFFDDDAMAAFVSSSDALVEWHSLQIDRYDVRHLLTSPPPPRHRNRNADSKSSDEVLIDQERYLDLPQESDQPDIEDDEEPCGGGYHSVSFSYGDTEDSAAQKNTDGGMESSGYLPPFTIPGNIAQSLPPTEKIHQIIARTAMFVSKHGGQTEIILRVKQGDNPTFGFLMPDHRLHAYFRYLVEHPDIIDTESGEKTHEERKKAGSEHDNSNSAGGALSLLGSVYGSGEDEDGDEGVNPSVAHNTGKGESVENATKDEPVSRKPILSNKENVPTVKKNSSIIASKLKNVKGVKREGNSGMFSAAEKSKNYDIGATSKPVTVEPPLELKRLIDKLVEFIMKNGKQFEATLIEQDSNHERFPFLHVSNQYHSYYLKALQAAEESKVNGKRFYSGKDDLGGRWINKKTGNDFSLSPSDCDVPFECDRKEKFKMVISKSKKEEQESEKEVQESGVTVDAAAAAAILQAATGGIKNSGSYNHLNRSEGGNATLGALGGMNSSDANLTEEQKRKAERLKKAKMFVALLKSGAAPTKTGTSRGSSVEPLESGVLRSASEVNLTNQRKGSLGPAVVNKLAAAGYLDERQSERLSKRKYRSKPGGCEDDEDSHNEEHEEDHSSGKHKSRSRRVEDDGNENALENERQSHSSEEYKNEGASSEEDMDRKHSKSHHLSQDDGDERDEKHNNRHSKRKYRSTSRRHEDEEAGNAVENERRHRRRRLRSHTSEENENGEESDESYRENKRYKPTRRSHHSKHGDHNPESIYEEEGDKKYLESRSRRRHGSRSRRHHEENEIESTVEKEDKHHRKRHLTHSSHEENNGGESSGDDMDEDNGREDIHKEEKDRKRSRKSHHSSHESSRKRHSSEQHKKHCSHHSHHSRNKRSWNARSSRDKESRHRHKHGSSSDDEPRRYRNSDKPEKEHGEERDELEEGEISSKVSEESRGITSSDGKKGTLVDVMSSQQRAPSQPSETTEIPADLRAKIRAMLMSTRS